MTEDEGPTRNASCLSLPLYPPPYIYAHLAVREGKVMAIVLALKSLTGSTSTSSRAKEHYPEVLLRLI